MTEIVSLKIDLIGSDCRAGLPHFVEGADYDSVELRDREKPKIKACAGVWHKDDSFVREAVSRCEMRTGFARCSSRHRRSRFDVL